MRISFLSTCRVNLVICVVDTEMLGDEAVGNATDLFYIRTHPTALFQDFKVCHGPVGQVQLEQSDHDCWQKKRVDSN